MRALIGSRRRSTPRPSKNRRRVFDGAAIAGFRLRIAARGVAGHHVNPLDAGRRDIVERAGNARLEFLEPIRQRRQPTLAVLPATGRQVEQSLRKPIALQTLGDRPGRIIVGKKKLYGREARFRRRVEAVEERALGEHHREVGGELGHERNLQRCAGEAGRSDSAGARRRLAFPVRLGAAIFPPSSSSIWTRMILSKVQSCRRRP